MREIEVNQSRDNAANRMAALAVSVVLAALICILFFPPLQLPEHQSAPDSISYYAIAGGKSASAYYYYAGRILSPVTAGFFARTLGLNLPDAFRLVSCGAVIVLSVGVALWDGNVSVIPFLFVPIVIHAFRSYYLPDIFYAGLTVLFFLAFRLNRWLIIPAIFLLHLSRESTIVLTLITVIVLIRRERLLAYAVAVAGLAGMKITSTLVSQAMPNHHGISTVLFDILKVGYNIAANVAGVVAWTDTNSATTGCNPTWTANVNWGAIRQFGFCDYQWQRPIVTIVAILSAFGVMPLLIRNTPDRCQRGDVRIAFWYGLASLILVPLIGGTVERYTLYAYPLFWLYAAGTLRALPMPRRCTIAIISLSAAWTPTVVGPLGSLGIELLLYGIAWLLLKDCLPPPSLVALYPRLRNGANKLRNRFAAYTLFDGRARQEPRNSVRTN